LNPALISHSLKVILTNQAASGAYIASPTFPTYHYCWFRDGSFIAYAMDRYGQHESAAAFHQWAAEALLKRSQTVQNALADIRAGRPLAPQHELHTRYTLDGEDGTQEEWPNHQLDGFGTWLWALGEHQRLSGKELPETTLQAAELAADYLAALWDHPCYDCWEEYPQEIHTATLGAIYGGLRSLTEMRPNQRYAAVLAEIGRKIERQAVYKDYLVKFPGSYTVDASLIGLAVPYQMFSVDDPIIRATIRRIEATLLREGGVHRYPTDTYYGGGAWILLTGWLGWYYVRSGQIEKAEAALAWIEQQADAEGNLPEQVPSGLNDPNYFQPWVERWGPPATPLLWSHANYLILAKEIETVTSGKLTD
jgi:GH15 family glucan-1,4-alpha-glucosidase